MIWALPLLTMKLIPHSLTGKLNLNWHSEFDYIQYTKAVPSYIQCSTSRQTIFTANLKVVSKKTSYHEFRLEFLRHAQVIPQRFNDGGFSPPCDVTHISTCRCINQFVSCLLLHTKRPIKTRFHYGSISST